MLAKTPPMGWNSWNTFGNDISESLLKETADAFIDQGLKEAGYEYVVIDDCWSKMAREKGKLVADPDKFPGGMKALAGYIHGKGLKFGIYSCAGTKTCAGYPSSLEHEFADARTFADWGVDYLKYDYCNRPDAIDGHILYRRMAMALRNCGRDILFSACTGGNLADEEKRVRGSGAHIWRSTHDIQDSWSSIADIVRLQEGKDGTSALGCFNDMDMLVVGMYGKGNVALGGCTDEEYRTHFSLWCMMNSPLMIGCDVRNMSAAAREILTNKEVIALNQDEEGRQAYVASNNYDWNTHYAYAKPLSNGEYAICLVNMDDNKGRVNLFWWDMGLPTASGYGFMLRDLWAHEDLGVFAEGVSAELEPHACKLYRAKLAKL